MDVVVLINEYLADKSSLIDIENDTFNIVDNQIYSWTFTNIPQPSEQDLLNCQQAVVNKQRVQDKLKLINDLESQITPRRIREAVLSGDNSFIQSIEDQIRAIRSTLE